MCWKLFAVLLLVLASDIAKGVDQCDDFPVEVEFYAGPAPITGEFVTKEIGELIGGIVHGLEGLFKPANYSFPEDMWNSSLWNISDGSMTGPMFGSGSIASVQQDAKPPANPLGGFGKNFKVPDFFKKVVPQSQIHGNATPAEKNGFPGLAINFGAQPTTNVAQENYSVAAGDESADSNAWGITVPMNTILVELAKIENGKVSETHKLDAKFLSSNKTAKDINKFAQYLDLTEFKIKSNDMFIACLTMTVVRNDKQSTCQRCIIMRVCDSLDMKCAQKFVTLRAPDSKVRPYEARLQYWVLEPPLADMKLVTKVKEKESDARCAENNHTAKPIEKTSKLFANSVIFVDIPDLSPKGYYIVEANLQVTWGEKSKAPFGWPTPLTIPNYLDTKVDYVIYPCGQNPAIAPAKV